QPTGQKGGKNKTGTKVGISLPFSPTVFLSGLSFPFPLFPSLCRLLNSGIVTYEKGKSFHTVQAVFSKVFN
ncbi:MAG: hypothetical protein IJB68_08980, partial [Ruminococcus sp.]|nr:hypothetical protein [Ruminococcus sp.]